MDFYLQNAWLPLRTAEVTVADNTMDGTTASNTLWDLTLKNFYEVGPEAKTLEIYFAGEGTDNATAAAKIYLQGASPPAHRICDISVRAGSSYFKGKVPNAPFTPKDVTTYLVADTIILDTSNDFYYCDVYDNSMNAVAILQFPVRAHSKVFVEFKSIAGVNQFTRITPYGRSW